MRVTVDGCMGPQEAILPDTPRLTPFRRWCDGGGPPAPPAYVYVASSWRNLVQVAVVAALRAAGLEAYDYRAPAPGSSGFRWTEIDPDWLAWTPRQWRAALSHPVAREGYARDRAALDRADCGVLVLPCGRSAHLEAGFLAGRGVPVFTLALAPVEPELMGLLLGPPERICASPDELFDALCVPR